MSARVIRRRVAAGTTALALAGLGLVGIGATAASAVDEIPANDYYGGTFYLANADTAADFTESSVIGWTTGLAAIPAPSDWTNPPDVVPADATGIAMFISPIGQETNRNAWNAFVEPAVIPSGFYLGNPAPAGLINAGPGSPSGTAAVAAAGGDYSLGWAYTKDAGLHVVEDGLFYVHVHVAAGTLDTATYTYERVLEESAPLPSTTTSITSAPTDVQVGDTFSLTATVAPSAATGTVEFFNGATSLGTAPVSGGTATLASANITTPGNASITAVYSGQADTYAGSTSAAVTIHVHSLPVPTTITVGADSADNLANHDVVLSADVVPATAQGSVTFTGAVNGGSAVTLGTAPVSAGHAEITVAGMQAGDWEIDAAFVGVDPYVNSTSAAAATLTLDPSAPKADPDDQDVTVTIPEGTLTITTPYTAASPLPLGNAVLDQATSTWNSDSDPLTPGYQKTVFTSASDADHAIQVLEARPGNPGWKAYVKSTDFVNGASSFSASYLGLTDVQKVAVTGSKILLADVTPQDVPSLSGTEQQFAKFVPTTDNETGSVLFSANIALSGVPSSVQPGLYRATLTFTAY